MIVLALMVDDDGKVLIALREPEQVCGGLWEFPGGKVEKGETPQAALLRELVEETGMTTQTSCLAPFTFGFNHQGKLMLAYICRVFELSDQNLFCHRFCRWEPPNKLMKEYPMPLANQGMVAMLRDYV